ncbi:Interferon-induced protein with tetratricopeptide repeats 5 [Acipenser ruthenus]|uniref:Interferon-induced protein with tetratricopeptide repeats 5 n=1 Tax=Acipenser ruthenus TaxID=7906 RepID=A0A444UAF1_ACIRT|nr:interferon-induced protein with tetratricopeptide repeats 5-like [Acipenser ruthenus]RXM32154.1 Interferon-induced protein with tetratricopeptide repeats 5 [Acipenser ruthenus]
MHSNQENALKTKLLQLECHFTWGFNKEDTDLNDLKERLEEQIQLNLGKDRGIGRSYNQLAHVKHLQNFNEEAEKHLEKVEELAKTTNEHEFEELIIVTYGNFAWLYYHMGEITKAEKYLEKLEDICKKFPNTASRYSVLLPAVYGEKGWSFLKYSRKYYERAKECFEKALEEEPNEKEWNTGYAIVLYRIESFEIQGVSADDSTAVKQLRRALELDPENTVVMVLLGLKLGEYKQNEEALKLVEQALKLSPDNPHVTRYVAKFFRKHGSLDKSLELLMEALLQTPNSGFLHHQISLCYKRKIFKLKGQRKQFQDSTEIKQLVRMCIFHLEKVTNQKPSFFYAQLDLASMYAESRNNKKAEDLFEKILKMPNIKSENLQALYLHYGDFQMYHNRSESLAIQCYKDGLKIQNNNPEQIRCYKKLKNIAERRIARNSQDGEAYGILGFAHQMNNERLEAIECYEKAILRDPGNDEYLSALCDLRLSLN